jgi:hypothetical protein
MPKPIRYNPFDRSFDPLTKPTTALRRQIADQSEWMIDNPMLETRNYSVHLRHGVADRLDEVLVDLVSRLPEADRTELNISRIIEIAVGYLLADYARDYGNSELLRRLTIGQTSGDTTDHENIDAEGMTRRS